MHDEAAMAKTTHDCAPGVGEYDVAFAGDVSAPAFSFPKSLRPIAEEESGGDKDAQHLGPGAYTLPPVERGPAYTMGEAPKHRIVPGSFLFIFIQSDKSLT
jgi:hypothetical protein